MLSIKDLNLVKTAYIVVILGVLAFFPLLLPPYYVLILKDVLAWLALAISWNFFSGYTKYISLGSAAFFGIGWYITAWVMNLSSLLPVIVIFAGLINFALALVVGLVTLRLKGIYFAIVTFSVSMVVSSLISAWETEVTHTKGTYIPTLFYPIAAYYAILITTIVVLLLTTFLRRSKFGLALKMIGENEEAAVHVGVNASMYKVLGFATSAMLMGLIGGCFVTVVPYVNTNIAFDPKYSFYPPVMSLLGGMGTVYGPMIGSIFLTLLVDYLTYLGAALIHVFLIILGAILILVVMFMPNGVMGIVEAIRTKGLSGALKEYYSHRPRWLFRRRKRAAEKPTRGKRKMPAKASQEELRKKAD